MTALGAQAYTHVHTHACIFTFADAAWAHAPARAGPSKVRVQCPEVEGNDKLIGQLLEVEVASLQDTVCMAADGRGALRRLWLPFDVSSRILHG